MWEKVKLGVICDILGGYAFQSEQYTNNEIPLVRISNITESSIVIDYQYTITESPKYSAYEIKKGDILVALSGATTGKFGMFTDSQKAYLNQRVGLIRAKANICQAYIFNYLNLIKDDILRKAGGAAQPNISTKELANFEIPVPPQPIQEKIAAILDKADEFRRKDQELQRKYDELAQAIFIDMFGDPVKNEKGWEVRKLGEICRKITDGTHHSPKNTNEGYKYVTAKHIKNCKLDFNSNPTYVSETDHKEIFERCNPEFQDVLYIKDGATTGMAAVNTLTEEFSMLSSLALFKLNKSFINHDYLTYYLNADFVKENLIREFMAGAAIKRFTLQKIKNFNILLPPLHLQQAFAKKIELINELKEKANSTKSEELFQSLLQRAFKGDLVNATELGQTSD
ncbi:restriction endonuclease subunit S [Olivibacter ginsenosidimutans]|uniref:Restriction endonuclease subunit S n=1 Tax=Olivibacter ginsenosidimutans TaxID=1176537 RepID=A0ABP9BNN2_9SPHI